MVVEMPAAGYGHVMATTTVGACHYRVELTGQILTTIVTVASCSLSITRFAKTALPSGDWHAKTALVESTPSPFCSSRADAKKHVSRLRVSVESSSQHRDHPSWTQQRPLLFRLQMPTTVHQHKPAWMPWPSIKARCRASPHR